MAFSSSSPTAALAILSVWMAALTFAVFTLAAWISGMVFAFIASLAYLYRIVARPLKGNAGSTQAIRTIEAPFLRLPVEIRTNICRFCLDLDVDGSLRLSVSNPSSGLRLFHNKRLQTNILDVNRKISEEGRSVLYGNPLFTFDGRASIFLFLAQIGREVENVKRITLEHGASQHFWSQKNYDLANFKLLSRAVQLKQLQVKEIPRGHRRKYAYDFLSMADPRIRSVWLRTGNELAWLDVVKFQGTGSNSAEERSFKEELKERFAKRYYRQLQ